jgi:hypothetical protein
MSEHAQKEADDMAKGIAQSQLDYNALGRQLRAAETEIARLREAMREVLQLLRVGDGVCDWCHTGPGEFHKVARYGEPPFGCRVLADALTGAPTDAARDKAKRTP